MHGERNVHKSRLWSSKVLGQTHRHTHTIVGTYLLFMVSFSSLDSLHMHSGLLSIELEKLCVHRWPEAAHAILTLLTCKWVCILCVCVCLCAVLRLDDNRTKLLLYSRGWVKCLSPQPKSHRPTKPNRVKNGSKERWFRKSQQQVKSNICILSWCVPSNERQYTCL